MIIINNEWTFEFQKILFWSFQQFTSMASHDELKSDGNNRKQHELYHVSCSIMFLTTTDTTPFLNYIHTSSSSFEYGIGAVFVYFSVITLQTQALLNAIRKIGKSKFAMGGNFVKNDMLVIFIISLFFL